MKQVGWLIAHRGHVDKDRPFNSMNERLTDSDKKEGWTESAVYIETDEDRFTDPQGTVWTRPTAWAYYAACRSANFWRGQREAIREILDQRVPEDAPAASPIHCQHCGGDGLEPLSTYTPRQPCGFCRGSGRAADISPIPQPVTSEQCPDCHGVGYHEPTDETNNKTSICDVCHGNGYVLIKQINPGESENGR